MKERLNRWFRNYGEVVVALFIFMGLVLFFTWFVQKPETNSPKCAYCNINISVNDDYIVAKDQTMYHVDCFRQMTIEEAISK